MAYARCQRSGSDCKCPGYQRGCSEKAVLWPLCFDRQASSSVAVGPILREILSLKYPVFIKANFVLSRLTSQRGIRTYIVRSCVLKQSWSAFSQKQRNNGSDDRVIPSWTFASCQRLFHLIILSLQGGYSCDPHLLVRRLNFSFVPKLVIVRTRTQTQTQTVGSCSDLLWACACSPSRVNKWFRTVVGWLPSSGPSPAAACFGMAGGPRVVFYIFKWFKKNQEKNILWHANIIWNRNLMLINKILLKHGHGRQLTHCLWLISHHNSGVIRPAEPKIYTVWHLTEVVCRSVIWGIH